MLEWVQSKYLLVFLGYFLSLCVGTPVTAWWSKYLHRCIETDPAILAEAPSNGLDEQNWKRIPWIPKWLGILERLIVTTLIGFGVAGAPAFMGTWILAKSAGGWLTINKNGTTHGRAVVMVGLLGSAFSMLVAIVAGLIVLVALGRC